MDSGRAVRDYALRYWNSQLRSLAVPRILLEGHSVIVGSGASVTSKSFPRLVQAGLGKVHNGVSVTIDGHAGFTVGQILALGAPAILNAATPVGLVVFMGMLNDYSTGVPSATTKANLVALFAAYRAANGAKSPSFLLLIEWQRQDAISNTEPWANYVAVAKAVAAADRGVTVVDLSARINTPLTDTLGFFTADNVHPNDTGHAYIAGVILAAVEAGEASQGFSVHYEIPCAVMPPVANTLWNTRAQSATAWGGYNLESDVGAVNNAVTFGWIGAAGTYSINLCNRQGSNRGQYVVYIDGVAQNGGVQVYDGYAAGPTDATNSLGTTFQVVTDGPHTIQLVMATKNAASTGFVGSIAGILLTRTGPLT